MNKVLYAVGMIDADLKKIFEDNELGVTIDTVENVDETFKTLTRDPLKYQYVIICIKAFVYTGGLTMEDAFQELARIVKMCPNTRFCLLDEERSNRDNYQATCSPIPNINYTTISKIQLRTFKTVLDKFLNGDAVKAKPQQVEVKEEPAPPRTLSMRKSQPAPKEPEKSVVAKEPTVKLSRNDEGKRAGLFAGIMKPKDKGMSKGLGEIKDNAEPVENKKLLKADKVIEAPQVSYGMEEGLNQDFQKELPKKQVEPTRKSIRLQQEAYKGRSILVTELVPCGSTSVALMLSKSLAKTGLKVCYVEISKSVPSSNAIFSSEDVIGTPTENILSALASDISAFDYDDYIGIYKGVHIVRDGVLVDKIFTANHLVKMIGVLNRTFDTVIYDIDSTCIREYSTAVSMMSDRIMVLSNSYIDILNTAISLKSMIESDKDSDYALYTMLTSNGKVIVNKFLKGQSDMEGGTIKSSDVPSLVADVDRDLIDFELMDLIGTVPISNAVAFDPFSQESCSLVNEILSNIGVEL